jgi:hypothetical protein
MAVGDYDICPAVVVEIYEADAPAQEPRVSSKTRLEGGVFENEVALVGFRCENPERASKIPISHSYAVIPNSFSTNFI